MALFACAFDGPALEIGGVTLYRIPPETLARYGGMSAVEAETRTHRTLFNALLAAAWKYTAEGKDPRELTPVRAKNLNLLPADWLTGASWVPEWLAGTEFRPDSLTRDTPGLWRISWACRENLFRCRGDGHLRHPEAGH